jgi:hypothetical protein
MLLGKGYSGDRIASRRKKQRDRDAMLSSTSIERLDQHVSACPLQTTKSGSMNKVAASPKTFPETRLFFPAHGDNTQVSLCVPKVGGVQFRTANIMNKELTSRRGMGEDYLLTKKGCDDHRFDDQIARKESWQL